MTAPPSPAKWPLPKTILATAAVVYAAGTAVSWVFSPVSSGVAWGVVAVVVVLIWAAIDRARPAGASLAVVLGTAAGIAGAWVVVGWWTQAIGPGTPAAGGVTDPTDPAQRAQVLAYADSLDFDSLTHRAADERFLTILDTVRTDTVITGVGPRTTVSLRPLADSLWRVRKLIGPWAKIVPESRAYRNDPDDIGVGRGRIVARVYVDPAFRAPNGADGYPPLNLPPGLSYLWIDSLGPRADTARVVIIPANPQLGVRVGHVRYTSVRRVWETYSRAAWHFFRIRGVDPDCFNVTCPYGCCDNCWNPE